MKKAILYLLLVFCAAGCSRPKVIKDSDLEKIFTEIYLSNAYVSQQRFSADSLDIYSPIFKKYGYKPRDMAYTIANFSRRKSSRLSDVVAASSRELDRQYKIYSERVATLDTIDRRSQERFREPVLEDSLIRARKIADTAKLRIVFPAQAGEYTIAYNYTVDSLDKNLSLRTTITTIDTAGRRSAARTNWMRTNSRERYSVTLTAEPSIKEMEILFGNYRKEMTAPHLTVDSLRVNWMPPVKEALERMNHVLLDYKYRIDGKEYDSYQKDSCALDTHPPRLVEGVCDNG